MVQEAHRTLVERVALGRIAPRVRVFLSSRRRCLCDDRALATKDAHDRHGRVRRRGVLVLLVEADESLGVVAKRVDAHEGGACRHTGRQPVELTGLLEVESERHLDAAEAQLAEEVARPRARLVLPEGDEAILEQVGAYVDAPLLGVAPQPLGRVECALGFGLVQRSSQARQTLGLHAHELLAMHRLVEALGALGGIARHEQVGQTLLLVDAHLEQQHLGKARHALDGALLGRRHLVAHALAVGAYRVRFAAHARQLPDVAARVAQLIETRRQAAQRRLVRRLIRHRHRHRHFSLVHFSFFSSSSSSSSSYSRQNCVLFCFVSCCFQQQFTHCRQNV